MYLYVVDDYKELSKKAASLVAGQILAKPDSILGFATGSTPEGMYAELVKMYEAGEINFKNVESFNLDEYCGLDKNHNQSYHYFMNKHLFSKINMLPNNIRIPNGLTDNMFDECLTYEENIDMCLQIDLQILGLGHNGHIGFNEPSDHFSYQTHCVELSQSTREANARFFEGGIDEVPTHAITMGIGTILRTKRILLLVSGSSKAKILKKVLKGTVTPQVPASILRFHDDVIVIADKEAAAELYEN